MNTFYGNGSATSKASATAPNSNNFGLGLLNVSQGNLIERNKLGGNINGVYLGGGGQVTGNIIRANFIAGNPPIQVANIFGSAIGADIQDFSAAGTNTFDGNYCLTYAGSGPSPCPDITGPDEELQEARKRPSLDSLLNELWAILRPRTAPGNGLRQSRPTSEAALNRVPAR